MAEVYSRALAYLLPEQCLNCGGSAGSSLCESCRTSLEPVPSPCPECGLEQPVARCPRPTGGWSIATVVAPLRYESPLDLHIHALKFGSSRRVGRALGLLLADHLRGKEASGAIDAVIPVPLHRRRLLQRGFNQAHEIARPVASALGRPLLTAGIARLSDTQPQTLLSSYDRSRNVRGAFRVRRRLDGMVLAIVDDVITTGATVNALARALHRAGATEVHAWAVTRVSPPG